MADDSNIDRHLRAISHSVEFRDWRERLAACFYGEGEKIRAAREEVLLKAYSEHPERFVKKASTAPKLPEAVWTSAPKDGGQSSGVAH